MTRVEPRLYGLPAPVIILRSRIISQGVIAAILAGLLALSGPTAADAGLLHPDLIEEMERTPAGSRLPVLVTLAEQIDFAALEKEMSARGIRTRWQRHQFVLKSARDLAARSQPPLLGMLEDAVGGGRATAVRPFWVTNGVALEAESSFLVALSLRGDVGTIYLDGPIDLRLDESQIDGPPPASIRTAQGRTLPDNLIAVNVEPAWAYGYTGEHRLVCSFDTGADGDHPAFGSRWRGLENGVDWSHAWKDPYTGSSFPFDAGSHGTHVLGIMTADPPDMDPIGVAYKAKWIAAGVLIGWNVTKIIECYEWAVDPDGDPGTLADVPDVINNSWGTTANCDATFWNAIDLVEAAGIVNVIAVDNSGPGPMSVNSPESRADGPYRNFGVGNVDPHTPGYPIWTSSGRGPSPCDTVSIKPEMTAPGVTIYNAFPGGGYTYKTGTSMAAPHVSGAVAILRQVNPGLTVEQIKEILMSTAYDRGAAGEDNDYGWGILDVGLAVDRVLVEYPPTPNPRNLVGSAQAGGNVFLSWQSPLDPPPNNNLVGYRIYRAEDENPYSAEPLDSVGTFPTIYTDPSLSPGDYRYVTTAIYASGSESEPSNEVQVTVQDQSASIGSEAPDAFGLQAAPNPFREGTVIRLRLPDQGHAKIEIYDAAGRLVRTLETSTPDDGGEVRIRWDGRDGQGRRLPAGAFFARAPSTSGEMTQRLVVLR